MTGIYTGFYQLHYMLPRSFCKLKNDCYPCQSSKQPGHTVLRAIWLQSNQKTFRYLTLSLYLV